MASATAIEISLDTERMRAAVIFGLATSPSNPTVLTFFIAGLLFICALEHR
jgi:hypothetical protein